MSTYFTYYIGYKHEDKIYPLGPYDAFGELLPAYCVSQSYSSDLPLMFGPLYESIASDKLKEEFKYEEIKDGSYKSLKICPVAILPESSYIKSGYFLIDDVQKYENGYSIKDDNLFIESLTPAVYAAKFQSSAIFGLPQNILITSFDENGEEIEEEEQEENHLISDYMYYMYVDDTCKEYEASELRKEAYRMQTSINLPPNSELMIILIIG